MSTHSMAGRAARQLVGCGRLRGGLARLALVLVAALLATACVTTGGEPVDREEGRAASIRNVGIDHLQQGRTAMAIRKLVEANDLDPKDPATHLALGEAYRRKGMLDRAEQEYKRAIEVSPKTNDFNRQETVLNLSALYIQMKRYDDAIAQCRTLVDDPTFSTPWRALTNMGWAAFKLGQITEARRYLEEALDFHPRYAPANLDLGIVEQQARQYLPALRRFEYAVEGDQMPADAIAEANYRMAEIYVALGKRAKAIEHFQVALDRSPYGEWGAQSQSYLELLQ
jgi:type IV pilus assembly protein PilF